VVLGGQDASPETRITAIEDHEPNQRDVRLGPPERRSIIRVVEMAAGQRSAMHRTRTVDYEIVLEGEVYLVMEDSETRLQPGGIVVQRGTNHAWDNLSEVPARMVFILLDAEFAPELVASVRNMGLVP
jgi:quercetin dioxygenase-like cupin family protein